MLSGCSAIGGVYGPEGSTTHTGVVAATETLGPLAKQAPSCDAGDAGGSITMLLEKLSVAVHEKLLPGGVALHSWAAFGLDVNGAQFQVRRPL